jgi:hypothetical protein
MLVQICIAIATVALVGVAIALIRAVGQLGRTAEQLERTMSRVEQTIPEVERTILEAREVLDTVGNVARRADHLAGEFADVGSRIARTTSMVVDDVVAPVTRVAAVARGVRVGATTLLDTILRRRNLGPAVHPGGNHDE